MKKSQVGEEFGELLKEVTRKLVDANEVVLVLDASTSEVDVYDSVEQLVMEFLAARSQMGVCAPLFNVVLDRMDSLEAAAKGGRPEGRPPSVHRDFARKAFERGAGYETILWLLKAIWQSPGSLEYSRDYTFGTGRTRALTLKDAKRLRRIVDDEWKLHHEGPPPAPPRNWWKHTGWGPVDEKNVTSAEESNP